MLRNGTVIWRDGVGGLHRLRPDSREIDRFEGQRAIASPQRMIESSDLLWSKADQNTIRCVESDTLTVLGEFKFLPSIIDIDSAGDGSIFALVVDSNDTRIVTIDRTGRAVDTASLDKIIDPKALVFLRESDRFVTLSGGPHHQLQWYKTLSLIHI